MGYCEHLYLMASFFVNRNKVNTMPPKPMMLKNAAGEEDTLANWSKRSGVPIETIRMRVKKKRLSLDEAMKPAKKAGITFEGKFYEVSEIAEITGHSKERVLDHIYSGWTERQILGLDLPPRVVEWEGEKTSIHALAKRYGKSHQLVSQRMAGGKTLYEALTTPIRNPYEKKASQ